MLNDALQKVIPISELDSFHDYGDPFSNVRYYHHLKARLTVEYIKKEASIHKVFMDAGAGRGPYSAIASPLFKHIYMYEYDKDELSSAITNTCAFKNISSGNIDLREIPLPDSSVDTAICCEVLEHIPDEERALIELKRVLKDNGKILLSMPNAFSLFYLKVRNLANHKEILRHMKNKNIHVTESGSVDLIEYAKWEMIRHISFPFWKIENLAKRCGFKIIKRRGANIIPMPYPLRKFLMNSFPLGLRAWVTMDKILGVIIPFIGSFYFLELKK
jgi:2-polyprenyl-3-methyl-5-hydroxy-6-metoxy-1,4-benzoquinol methylase